MGLALPAAAQDAPAGAWAFAVGAGTDNRSKGASKSDGDAYVWGEAEWENASGLIYGGAGFQTIKSSSGSDLEVEVGFGLRPDARARVQAGIRAQLQLFEGGPPPADGDAATAGGDGLPQSFGDFR